MIAGIVLGPSLGRYFPGAFDYLFPAYSLTTLAALSQLGLLLFVFLVGLSVDLKHVAKQAGGDSAHQHVQRARASCPGNKLATLLYQDFAGQHVGISPFALFMGTAMSITAFPVLARILKEFELSGTEIGSIAISCVAVTFSGPRLWKAGRSSYPISCQRHEMEGFCCRGRAHEYRGLVELVVLNAGLELRILTPKLFTMMVIMTLMTTFMTMPILNAMGTTPDIKMEKLGAKCHIKGDELK